MPEQKNKIDLIKDINIKNDDIEKKVNNQLE